MSKRRPLKVEVIYVDEPIDVQAWAKRYANAIVNLYVEQCVADLAVTPDGEWIILYPPGRGTYHVPRTFTAKLAAATLAELQDAKWIGTPPVGVHWPALDEDVRFEDIAAWHRERDGS